MWATRIALVFVVACDFTSPPPKQQQPPPPAKVDKLEGSATPITPAPDVVSPDCLDTAAHIVDATIAAVVDEGEKANQERNRALLVRKTAEECSRKKWPQRTLDCYNAATTVEAMRGCETIK